jgi:hypothetical protein
MFCWPTSLPTENLGDLHHRAGAIVAQIADHHVRFVHQHTSAATECAHIEAGINVAVKLRTADDDLRQHGWPPFFKTRIGREESANAVGGRGDFLHHGFELLDRIASFRHDLLAFAEFRPEIEELSSDGIARLELGGETFHLFDEP